MKTISRISLILALSCVSSLTHASFIRVDTEETTINQNGNCSLPEALYSAYGNYLSKRIEAEQNNTPFSAPVQIDDCEEGTIGLDNITLPEGTFNLSAAYVIPNGANDAEVSVGTTGLPIDEAFEIRGEGQSETTLIVEAGMRAFDVHADISFRLNNLTLRSAGPGFAGDGGFIRSTGFTQVQDARLENATGANGGAIHLYRDLTGSPVLTRTSFSQENVEYINNTASGSGGAIYMDVTVGQANPFALTLGRAAFIGNTATVDGGAMYIGGTTRVELRNITVTTGTADRGGGIYFGPNVDPLIMNNVTVVANTATGTAQGGALFFEDQPGNVNLTNSLIGGNTPDASECYFMGAVGFDPDANANYVSSTNVFSSPANDTDCPVSTNDRTPILNANVLTAPDAQLLPLQQYVQGVQAYLPNVNAAGGSALIDFGAASASGDNCETVDTRGFQRNQTECDVGAVEWQIGIGQVDDVRTVWNVPVTLDVLANDVGDSSVTANPATDCNGTILDCIQIIIPPERGQVQIVAGGTQGVQVLYTPDFAFHGEDRFAYRAFVQDAVVSADVDGDGNAEKIVESVANIISEPPEGGFESEEIGSFGFASLAALLFMAVRRLKKIKIVFFGVVVLISLPARAVDISVTTLLDVVDNTDSLCSLREAIISATDGRVNLEPACADGAFGEDVIKIVPTGTIEISSALTISSLVTIEGIVPDSSDQAKTITTVIQAATGGTNSPTGASHRLFNVTSNTLKLRHLELRYGNATGESDPKGGAIRSAGSLALFNVDIHSNIAEAGGGIFLDGGTNSLVLTEVEVFNNFATGTGVNDHGGGIMTASSGLRRIEIEQSLIANNAAASGTGGAYLGTQRSIDIDNSTITNNIGGANGTGGVDATGSPSALLNIINSTIAYNGTTAALGANAGGLAWAHDIAQVHNSILAGNEAAVAFTFPAPLVLPVTFPTIGTATASDCPNLTTDNLLTGISPGFSLWGTTSGCDDGATNGVNGNEVIAFAALTAQLPQGIGNIGGSTRSLLVNSGAAVNIIDLGKDPADTSITAGTNCEPTDQRGAARTSGNRCDRGALEFVSPTAVNDETFRNLDRTDRSIIIDIFANDTVDAGNQARTASVEFDTDPTSATFPNQPPAGSKDCTPLPTGWTVTLLDTNSQADIDTILANYISTDEDIRQQYIDALSDHVAYVQSNGVVGSGCIYYDFDVETLAGVLVGAAEAGRIEFETQNLLPRSIATQVVVRERGAPVTVDLKTFVEDTDSQNAGASPVALVDTSIVDEENFPQEQRLVNGIEVSSFRIREQPTNGTVTISRDGILQYTPENNFFSFDDDVEVLVDDGDACFEDLNLDASLRNETNCIKPYYRLRKPVDATAATPGVYVFDHTEDIDGFNYSTPAAEIQGTSDVIRVDILYSIPDEAGGDTIGTFNLLSMLSLLILGGMRRKRQY